MELAEKIHQCIVGKGSITQLLDNIGEIDDPALLSEAYTYILNKYDYLPYELMSEKYSVNELYAISFTEKYIRKPHPKTLKERDRFYMEIGYKKELVRYDTARPRRDVTQN